MAEGNGRAWNRVLATCIWGIVVAFAGLCITGFFYQQGQISAAEEKRETNTVRVVRIEECLLTVQKDIGEIKQDVRSILRNVKDER